MTEYKEIVKGKIITRDGPLEGARVEIFDKDMLIDDNLGNATTDADGCFQVSFTWADYKDGPYEDKPDFFLNITKPDTGKSIKTAVYDELKGKHDENDVEVYDLGVIEIA
jgi:hypothetical protein